MKYFSLRDALCGAAFLFTLCGAASGASAFIMEQHIANADTYVETFMPRRDQETKEGTGYFVERHYNFGLGRLTERYFAEQSLQVITTPFSELGGKDGADYIADKVKPEACRVAKEQQAVHKDAEAFIKLFCPAAK